MDKLGSKRTCLNEFFDVPCRYILRIQYIGCTLPCQGRGTGSIPVIRSMLFGLFSKITREKTLSEKIANSDAGVYLYILFPIAVAFLLTFGGARLISHFDPGFFIHIVPGLHIHHYSYGVFVLAMAGYVALVNNSPRDRYLTSLLYGMGLGLVFDEFGLWLRLSDASAARWSYDGVVVLIAFFILMISAESGIRMWNRHFAKKTAREAAQKEPVLDLEEDLLEVPPTP